MKKKSQIHFTTGFIIRLTASLIDAVSLPFLVMNPTNIYAQIAFGFGNFLLIIGGLTN